MALINEHVVKEEILKVLDKLYNEYSFAVIDSSDMFHEYIDAVDRDSFNLLLEEFSQELTKILK